MTERLTSSMRRHGRSGRLRSPGSDEQAAEGLAPTPEAQNEVANTKAGGRSLRMRAAWSSQVVRDASFGFALAVLAWPLSPNSLLVWFGITGSWQSALAMAAHNGTAFGTRVAFTYGPLGFLTVPQLNYGLTAFASFVFTLAVLDSHIHNIDLVATPRLSGLGGHTCGLCGGRRIPSCRWWRS